MTVCITNRSLCNIDFLERIKLTASMHPRAIILREKDLSLKEYICLADKVSRICLSHNVEFIINGFIEAARELKIKKIHLSMNSFRENRNIIKKFSLVGVSVHSTEEASEAEALGADYLTAGHIFPTKCKEGLPPRGLDFLKNVCSSVKIPVYAIGGITNENRNLAIECGAADVCVMSGAMNGSYIFDTINRQI